MNNLSAAFGNAERNKTSTLRGMNKHQQGALAAHVDAVRQSKGFTVSELARAAGVTRYGLAAWINGDRGYDADRAVQVLAALGLEVAPRARARAHTRASAPPRSPKYAWELMEVGREIVLDCSVPRVPAVKRLREIIELQAGDPRSNPARTRARPVSSSPQVATPAASPQGETMPPS